MAIRATAETAPYHLLAPGLPPAADRVVGGAMGTMGVEQVRDFNAVKHHLEQPGWQAAYAYGQQNPDERRRVLAILGGILAGKGAEGLLGMTQALPWQRIMAAGGVGGAVDAGIRSNFNPQVTAAGSTIGALASGIMHGAMGEHGPSGAAGEMAGEGEASALRRRTAFEPVEANPSGRAVAAELGVQQGGASWAHGLGETLGGLVREPLRDVRALGNEYARTGGDARAIPWYVATTPPEEVRRANAAGAAAMAGFAAPAALAAAPVRAILPSMLTGPLAQNMVGGGVAAGTDAALRNPGDPANVVGQTIMGTGLGAAGHYGGQLLERILPKKVMAPLPIEALQRSLKREARMPINEYLTRGRESLSAWDQIARESAWAAALPVRRRIEAYGEEGREVARRIENSIQEALIRSGKPAWALREAGFAKYMGDEALNYQFGRVLRGEIPETVLNEEGRNLLRVVRKYFGSVPPRMRKYGGKITLASGEKGEFPKGYPTFFPHVVPPVDAPPAVVEEMARSAFDRGKFASVQDARDFWADWVMFQKSDGVRGGDKMALRIAKDRGVDLATARGMMSRFAARNRQNRFSSLEFAREFDFPMWDPNPARVIPAYIEGAEKRLAQIKWLGQENQRIGRYIAKIQNADQREALDLLVHNALGTGVKPDEKLMRWVNAGRKMGLSRFTPFTTLRNLTQSANTLLSSDLDTFIKGALKAPTKEGSRIGYESGAMSESALHSVTHAVGSEGGFWDLYLQGIGFTPVERQVNRRFAASVGSEMAKKYAKRIQGNPADQFAAGQLRRLGLDPAKIAERGLKPEDELRAALDFTHRTQFRSHAMDLPEVFTGHPLGQSFAQFKTFEYQQGQLMANEVIDRIANGSPQERLRALRNVAIIATIYPLSGEAVNDIIYAVQGRQREPIGFQRYFEDMLSSPGFGTGQSVARSIQYGMEGKGSTEQKVALALLKTAAPPPVSVGAEWAGLVGGVGKRAFQGKAPTETQGRALIRAIPGYGGVVAPWFVPYGAQEGGIQQGGAPADTAETPDWLKRMQQRPQR